MDQLKANYPDTEQLLLDSGNLSGNPSPSGEVTTRRLVEGMSRLGYRAANVGERDLSMGWDKFQQRTAGATFPFVSTNILRRDTSEPVFEPFVFVDVPRTGGGSTKVGVLGVVRFNPIFLKQGPDGSNLVIERPASELRRYIETVREKADVVVLLAALHREDARKIIREVPGIDLVIGSYGGVYNTREEREGDTWLLYSGNQGKRFGETRLFLGEGGGLESVSSYLHFLTERYPRQPEMETFVVEALTEAAAAKRSAASLSRGKGGEPATAKR